MTDDPTGRRRAARCASVPATPSGLGSRGARIHTNCAVVAASTFDGVVPKRATCPPDNTDVAPETLNRDDPERDGDGRRREPSPALDHRVRWRSRFEHVRADAPGHMRYRPRARSFRPAVLGLAAIVLAAGCIIHYDPVIPRTPAPTPTATPPPVTILTPADGDIVTTSMVVFTGTAPAGARVYRWPPGALADEVRATDGFWRLLVELDIGVNEVTIGTGDERVPPATVHVTYQP